MSPRNTELTRDELAAAAAAELPAREVMSVIDTDPTCIAISPKDGIIPPENPDGPPESSESFKEPDPEI